MFEGDDQKEPQKEEIRWNQKSKDKWVKEGDTKTRFFHNVANGRKRETIFIIL